MSPIKGLTNRPAMFPEIGQIRKGSPKDANGQMGRDLTYFRIEIDEKEVDTKKAIIEKYGERPTELPIVLAFNEVERVWDAWYEAYTAGRLVARADGEFFTYKIDVQTGEVLTKNERIPFDKDTPVGFYTSQKGKQVPIFCKPVGRLRVVLPDLQRLAYFTVMTTSIHDIINISSQIEAIATFNMGRIASVPLILKRRPKEISCPKLDGTRARYTKWMLSIEADPQWVALSLQAAKTLSLPEGATAYLPAGVKGVPQGEDIEYDEEDDSDIPGINDGIQDGEFSSMPEEPPATQDATPIDNNGHKRPYDPVVLQSKMKALVEHFEDKVANEGLLSKDSDAAVICSHIEQVWAGKKEAVQNRHSILKFLIGNDSIKAATSAEKLALKHWLKISKDEYTGEWNHCKEAGQECIKVMDYLLKKQGQGTLL